MQCTSRPSFHKSAKILRYTVPCEPHGRVSENTFQHRINVTSDLHMLDLQTQKLYHYMTTHIPKDVTAALSLHTLQYDRVCK